MKFTKFSIVLLFLLSLVAFALTVVLFSVRENEKAKRIQLEQINVELENQIGTLEADKQQLQARADDLDAKYRDAVSDLNEARADADDARRELAESQKTLDSQTGEMKELKKAVQMTEDRNRELEETLNKFEERLKEMQGAGGASSWDVSSFSPASSDTITVETADQSKVMELAPSRSSGDPANSAFQLETNLSQVVSESLQAGRVLLVNQKFNFVIINMGSKQGLQIGDSFLITENGEKVVKVQVEKLYDDYSAAKITDVVGNRLLLKEGNLVTRT